MSKVKKLHIKDFNNKTDFWKIYLPNLSEDSLKQIPEEILEQLVEDVPQEDITKFEDSYIEKFELDITPTALTPKTNEEEPENLESFFDKFEEVNAMEPEDVTGNDEEKPLEIEKEKIVEPKRTDLFNLPLVDAPVSTVKMNYDAFLAKTLKSTYFVILPISGYSANVRGMTVEELDSVKTSATSNEDRMDILARIIYSCILDTSIGKMSYDSYILNTAQTELPILLFGIMIKTFGHINTINYKCNSCGTTNKDINLDLNSLMQIKTDKVTDIMRKIDLKEEPEKYIKESLLKTLDVRFQLPKSRVVVSAKFGTLEKDVSLSKFKKHLSIKDGNLVADLLHFVECIFVPVFDKSGTEESGNFAKYTKTTDIYHYLKDMALEDLRVFASELAVLDDYQINFNREINCTHCRAKNEISVDIIPNFYYSIFQEMM